MSIPINNKIIILMIIVFVIIVTIILLLALKMSTTSSDTQVVINNISNNTIQSAWLTYRNDTYSFSINYLSNWAYEEIFPSDPADVIFSAQEESSLQRYQLSIVVEKNPAELSAEEWAKAKYALNINRGEKYLNNMEVGPYEGYGVTGIFSGDQNNEILLVANGNKMFVFTYPTNEENESLFKPLENYSVVQQMIASFKFIDD